MYFKEELGNGLSYVDSKMWEDITGLHIAASYLDPSLKGFSFVKDTDQRCNLSEQVANIVKENVMIAAKNHVYPTKELEDSNVEAFENDEQEREAGLNIPIRGQNMIHWLNLDTPLLVVNQGRSQAI